MLLDVVGDPDIGVMEFGFSQTGTAICLTGAWAPRKRSLVWLDKAGKDESSARSHQALMGIHACHRMAGGWPSAYATG